MSIRELLRGGDTSLREASLALADELSKGRNSLLISMNGPAGKMVMELRLYDPDLFSSETRECPNCKGSGETTATTQQHGPDDYEVTIACPECNGTGEKQFDKEKKVSFPLRCFCMLGPTRLFPDDACSDCPNLTPSARVPSSEEPDPHSFTLLRLDGAERPLFFVLEERYGDPKEEGYQEQREYFYEEHSCPTNWLRDCVAIIEAGDDDPHGFLTFVRSVPIPETWNDLPVNKDWKSIFPEAFDVTSYVNVKDSDGSSNS